MAHKFVLLVREFHLEREWADVVKIVVGKFPLLEASIQQSALSIQPEGSNWQLANSNWQRQNQDQNLEPQRAQRSAEEEERRTYHGGTETRRTVEAREMEGNLGPSLAVKAPLVQDDRLRRGDFAPRDFDRGGMRLGKVVAAALAIEILMAAGRSTQQSAFSNQPEESNWQLANGNWHDQNQDQNLESQRAPVRLAALAQGRLRNPEEMHALEDAHGVCAAGRAPCGRPVVYGERLGLAAMAHAPTNELGVLFLFGIVAADLGFRVERLQAAFPDCEAKREVAPGKWELVLLELEIYSRNFKSHRHDPRGCHGIVCWKHNWPDCPEWLEVIELSKVVK
jgi:hypothetical protein